MADRKDIGEVDHSAGELILGDEDAGEKIERQKQRVYVGAAASWEGIAAVRAIPKQQNEAAPITKVATIAPPRSQGIGTE